jgi:hypothetical protein
LRLQIPDEGEQQQQPQPASHFFHASIDSAEEEEEEVGVERRGDAAAVRRASKLSDLFDKKRRPDRKRWKDKQGKVDQEQGDQMSL